MNENKTPRGTLEALLKKISTKCRLVLVYGSYSSKSRKPPTQDSDVDFLIIYSKGTNPYELSSYIEGLFKNSGHKYDYSWYIEDVFLSEIEKGIDYFFWVNMLDSGEIIYADPTFLANFKEKLYSVDPRVAFEASIKSRAAEICKSLQDVTRDAHVMLVYALWLRFSLNNRSMPSLDDLEGGDFDDFLDKDTVLLIREFQQVRQDLKLGRGINSLITISDLLGRTQRVVIDTLEKITV